MVEFGDFERFELDDLVDLSFVEDKLPVVSEIFFSNPDQTNIIKRTR